MEAEWYRRVCRVIDQVSPHRRAKKQQFGDHLILKVYFWAVLHDRPVDWACRDCNWPEGLHPGVLPSQPTMSRRLRRVGLLQLLERTHVLLSEKFPMTPMLKQIDSKPLVVGHYSKDSDARRGRAAGEMARGYKLHALLVNDTVRHWTLAPMNVNDQVPALDLLGRLGSNDWGYVAADNQYDANPVYRAAAAVNHQLIAPPRKANAHVRDVKRNCSARIRSLDLCADPLRACGAEPGLGADLLRCRKQIERKFGHLVMLGLHAPPPWIRRPHRVALWTAAKLVIQMIRMLQIKGVTT